MSRRSVWSGVLVLGAIVLTVQYKKSGKLFTLDGVEDLWISTSDAISSAVTGGAAWLARVPDSLRSAFNYAASLYRLPTNLLERVAYQESHFREDIISGATTSAAGAVGIMQIVPKYHPDVDPTDARASITYAAKYLRDLYSQFGNWKLALAAYNWGPGNVSKNRDPASWPSETRKYVADISADVGLV